MLHRVCHGYVLGSQTSDGEGGARGGGEGALTLVGCACFCVGKI